MDQNQWRKAKILYKDQLAGILSETETGYQFVYDKNFVAGGQPIAVSLPLREEPYESKKLFSFFEGLLPEGWYLDIVSSTAKIDPHDSFGLLLATSSSTIGAVSVQKI